MQMLSTPMNMMAAQGTQLRSDLMMPGGASGVVVHVGNIDRDVTDGDLKATFDRVAKVLSAKIIRDMHTQESRGFGFVTLASQQDAETARQALNHERMGRKEIIISFNKKQAGSDTDTNSNIIVKNLDKRVTSRQFEQICSEFGKVVTSKIKDDENGNSLGYGYVQFENEEGATRCLKGIGEKAPFDKVLFAERFVPQSKRPAANQRCNLYIKQFPDGLNEKQIEEFIDDKFGKFGKIASKGVFSENKLNKFYSFVAFEDADKAKEAQNALNGMEFPGSEDKLFVDFAQSKFQRRQYLEQQHRATVNETNIYIRSLKKGTTENEVRKAFEKYGQISSICVRENELPGIVGGEKKVLGYAFVNFVNSAEARRAISEGKRDNDILALLDASYDRSGEFLFFHQPKAIRNQYMRMTKKNTPSRSPDTDMSQFMKMFQMMMMQSQGQGGKPRSGGRDQRGDQRGGYDRKPKTGGHMPTAAQQMPMAVPQYPYQFAPMMQPGMVSPFMNPAAMGQMNMMYPMNNMMQMPMFNPNAAAPVQPTTMPVQAQPQAQPAQASTKDLRWLKANVTQFNNMSSTEQKMILGNLMYQRVAEFTKNQILIPKITGMLIDLEVLSIQEIIEILEKRDILVERIEEAIKIIEEDGQA